MLEIEERLKDKIGEKNFKRAQLISENKFGHKINLIEKYYTSILDGYINIDDEWSSEYVIDIIKNKFEKTENKLEFIKEIIDTYDKKDDKTRHILEKYLRAIKKM